MAYVDLRVAGPLPPPSKDYEETTASSEAMIRLATINLMLDRLKPG